MPGEAAADAGVAGNTPAPGLTYDQLVDLPESQPEGGSDTPPAADETPAVEGGEAKKAEGEPEPKKETPAPKKKGEPTFYKVKAKDGREVEISEDTVILKKVDGKDVEISLKQALRHEAFDLPYQKLTTELKEKEAALAEKEQQFAAQDGARKKDLEMVASQLRTEVEFLGKRDVAGFIYEWCKVRQVNNPEDVESIFRQHFLSEAGVDEEDIKNLDASSRSRYGEKRLKDADGLVARQQRQQKYESYVAQQLKAAGVSDSDWKEARDKLKQDYKVSDLLDLEPADLEKFVEAGLLQAMASGMDKRLTGLIASASPDLKTSDPKRFEWLTDTIRRFSDYADEDILEVLKANLSANGEDEDEAVPIADDQRSSARRNPASNSNDDEVERVRREVEELGNPLDVFRD